MSWKHVTIKWAFFEQVGVNQQQNGDNLVKVGYYGSHRQLVLVACPQLREGGEGIGGGGTGVLSISLSPAEISFKGEKKQQV